LQNTLHADKKKVHLKLKKIELFLSVASGYNKNKDAKIGRETDNSSAEQPEVVIHSWRDGLWRFLDLPHPLQYTISLQIAFHNF